MAIKIGINGFGRMGRLALRSAQLYLEGNPDPKSSLRPQVENIRRQMD